jgi:glycosyltransferase involved in cell wall biosynthesis
MYGTATPYYSLNVGGNRELIEDCQTGLLFAAENIESLTAKVILLIGDIELQEKLKVNGLAYVTNVRN